MMPNLYMFSSRMHDWILRQINSTCVVTFQRNMIKSYPKVFKLLFHLERLWAQQLPTAIYYAFAVESATQACFLQFQDTSELPKRWHVPLVLFLSSLHPTKSKSEKSIRLKEVPLGYHKPTLVVPLRYLIILLIVVKWDSLGFAWYLAHKQTLNIILSWLAVK